MTAHGGPSADGVESSGFEPGDAQDHETSVAAAGTTRARRAMVLLEMAAHDLRTPLNAMAGWLQVLTSVSDLPAATRERALRGLQLGVAQQLLLIDGLSRVAGLESSEISLEIAATDMSAEVQSAIAALAQDAEARHVVLANKTAEQAGEAVVVATDGVLGVVMLRYLLAGALKFATKDSRLTIAVRREVLERRCQFEVTLGRSLLPADGVRALLHHLDGATGKRPAGSGAAFGLAVAQRVLEVLDGSLRVDAGATPQEVIFIVCLPDLPAGYAWSC